MFPHFFVSFFSRFQSFCESKEREKRRKGRRESSFFLVSGLPLPSPPLFHKKYKKFCQHKTSSVCALKSRTWHTIRRNARRLFSFPRHSSFVLYVFVLMFLCARIYCSFLLSFNFPTIENLLASPPQISRIKHIAKSKPTFTDSGSMPLSNLYFASVSIFKIFEVFLIDEG